MASFTHHIFICGNARATDHPRGSCGTEQSQVLRDAFKKALKTAGVGSSVRANPAGCLDQCEHGPVVVIYPQNIWYGHVGPEDAARIVDRTIVGGEIVEDLHIIEDCLNNPSCPHRAKASI
ncbi:(2Fe-2S) ferredoxin domain-containing protein [Isosphaeraceae bacterium EP7]